MEENTEPTIEQTRTIFTEDNDGTLTMTVVDPNVEPGDYYHVLAGYTTLDIDGEEHRAHMLGVIEESPYRKLPDEMIPENMVVMATYDYAPSEEELSMYIPEEYRSENVSEEETDYADFFHDAMNREDY